MQLNVFGEMNMKQSYSATKKFNNINFLKEVCMSKQIEVSDETWEKIKKVVSEDTDSFEINDLDDFIGKKLFIRTVTYHMTGKVKARIGNFFHLTEAAWIADSGRFMNAIKNGELNEVEPVGEAMININSIVDMFNWKHDLPKEQK